MVQIYGIKSFAEKLGQLNISPDKVFALEVCPFHSLSWSDSILCNNGSVKPLFYEHILRHVMIPAAASARHNNLKCVVCVGKLFNVIIQDLFRNKMLSESVHMPPLTGVDWPKKQSGDDKERNFSIYRVNALGNGEETVFLVLSASGSNKLPGDEFIECIDPVIAKIICDGRN